jgi:tellurite resistance protein TerC
VPEHAVFSPLAYWPLLAGFVAAVILLLALDLFVIERIAGDGTDRASERRRFLVSLAWTGLCVVAAIGAAFAFRAFAAAELAANPALLEGTRYAKLTAAEAPQTFLLEFLTGYLVEISLSVDNLFVFLVLFQYFAVPATLQHRVLFYGILGALIFRAIFIGAGAFLLQFHWVVWIFGIFPFLTGVKLLLTKDDGGPDPERNRFIRFLRKFLPVTDGYRGSSFFVRESGRWLATPCSSRCLRSR